MALYKRGGLWHYDFAVNGKRFRGSTKEKTQSKARSIESALMQEAMDRRLPGRRRAVLLADFSVRFLEWVSASRLELKSKMYYERGWKLLAQTAITQMQLSHITTDEAEVLHFGSSPANGNCALRTLRRMLGKAMEWGLISAAPRIKLLKEEGRSSVLDAEALAKLLEAAKQPLRDVALIVFDSGMRPSEVFQMRWEDLDWDKRMIFVPRGKTKLSRRHLPMSDRVAEALLARHQAQTASWVFPSDSKSGHLTTVAKAFREARRKAGLPKNIVLYTGRHTFGTRVLASTGNLSLVMRAMGHSSVATAMRYQHPDLELVRSAVNEGGDRASRHNSRHSDAA